MIVDIVLRFIAKTGTDRQIRPYPPVVLHKQAEIQLPHLDAAEGPVTCPRSVPVVCALVGRGRTKKLQMWILLPKEVWK
jgi:hypothetical protein